MVADVFCVSVVNTRFNKTQRQPRQLLSRLRRLTILWALLSSFLGWLTRTSAVKHRMGKCSLSGGPWGTSASHRELAHGQDSRALICFRHVPRKICCCTSIFLWRSRFPISPFSILPPPSPLIYSGAPPSSILSINIILVWNWKINSCQSLAD